MVLAGGNWGGGTGTTGELLGSAQIEPKPSEQFPSPGGFVFRSLLLSTLNPGSTAKLPP